MTKTQVPEFITKRVHGVLRKMEGYPHPDSAESGKLLVLAVAVCNEFVEALSEHPIVPTSEQVIAVRRACGEDHSEFIEEAKPLFAEWQRWGG